MQTNIDIYDNIFGVSRIPLRFQLAFTVEIVLKNDTNGFYYNGVKFWINVLVLYDTNIIKNNACYKNTLKL